MQPPLPPIPPPGVAAASRSTGTGGASPTSLPLLAPHAYQAHPPPPPHAGQPAVTAAAYALAQHSQPSQQQPHQLPHHYSHPTAAALLSSSSSNGLEVVMNGSNTSIAAMAATLAHQKQGDSAAAVGTPASPPSSSIITAAVNKSSPDDVVADEPTAVTLSNASAPANNGGTVSLSFSWLDWQQPEEWKLRQAADAVVATREALVHPYAKDVWLAPEFNIVACFQDLRREKRQVIQWTFTTAAQSLLETVQRQQEASLQKQRRQQRQQQLLHNISNNMDHDHADDDDDHDDDADDKSDKKANSDDDDDESDNDLSFMDDLPAVLRQNHRQELQQLRHSCFMRGLDNKEMAKKKNNTISNISNGGGTGSGNSARGAATAKAAAGTISSSSSDIVSAIAAAAANTAASGHHTTTTMDMGIGVGAPATTTTTTSSATGATTPPTAATPKQIRKRKSDGGAAGSGSGSSPAVQRKNSKAAAKALAAADAAMENDCSGIGVGAAPVSASKHDASAKVAEAEEAVEATTTTSTTTTSSPTAATAEAVASSTSTAIASIVTSSSDTASGPAPKKFTRNTPASSAAALDFRFTNSRAILCAAGNLTFSEITPDFENPITGASQPIDPTIVPQQIDNMGAVVVDARVYGRRTIAVVHNAVRRARLRYQFRKYSNQYLYHGRDAYKDYLEIPNPFDYSNRSHNDDGRILMNPWKDLTFDEDEIIPHNPNPVALTESWTSLCLPRLQAIVGTGAGHALYHDVQWTTRHGRIADFLKSLTTMNGGDTSDVNMGPHLIVTTTPDVVRFCQEFYDMRGQLRLVMANPDHSLRVMAYEGSQRERRKLRHYFPQATGLSEAPFHVLVTSYTSFLEDYIHFCQVPFEVVLFDDGASWMAASQGDPNSSLAALWETGIWSSNDHHAGLAGSFESTTTAATKWDFSFQLTENTPESTVKDALVGLTARHRIMTASKLFIEQRWSLDLLSVSGIVAFLAPHFASVVREEWDRSNIAKDAASMQHFRNLVARSMVVHHAHAPEDEFGHDMHKLALAGLDGRLPNPNRTSESLPPIPIMDDHFVSEGKVTFSRRGCLSWLGLNAAADQSWLRYELGMADFRLLLDTMKLSTRHGHFCEEITTASSTTATGATGQVAGTMAYRLAICCGRHFGSDSGLRQHLSAQHAPPGTWLCRTCGSDCITSQARTHHERTCGQPTCGAAGEQGGSVGATPTVGQGASKSGVGKKKSQRATGAQAGGAAAEEKDSDGSFRVPGYRGVWVNKKGKHFVKIEGKRFTDTKPEGDENVVFFDSCDDAARKYDEVVTKKSKKSQKVELNFKPDGTRNVYEDTTTSTASGLGGSAANVVPALSVINIKDLPPDVKPLLRDPRQTSRTGGNSKRHVYAYRGVCRQARKGHDRWQSQISFMGVNHYLGTFDSEWDAAAIYAWAHLILYGEEATRQAQKEGEEAAAAYEQEKRDIADGKIPEPPPKPDKKKKVLKKKEPKEKADTTGKKDKTSDKNGPGSGGKAAPRKRKAKPKENNSDAPDSKKRAKADPKPPRQVKEGLNVVLAKAVSKTPILGPRDLLVNLSDAELQALTAIRIQAVRKSSYCLDGYDNCPAPAIESVRCCLPILDSRGIRPVGAAMLMGIPASLSWSLQAFIHANGLESDESMTAVQMLAVEYDEGGVNEGFRSIMQGNVCIIGQANKRLLRHFRDLGGGSVPVGCSIGELDCHIGGVPGTCSSRAACIRYTGNEFQLACLNDNDIVTLNGKRITSDMKGLTLLNNDICSVGPRVFVFILPNYI